MIKQITINAGQRLEFYEQGDFFRLMQAEAPVTVEYFSMEKRVIEAEDVQEGYAEKFERNQFERIAITSAVTQAIQFVIRDGNTVEYDAPPTGAVTVKNTGGNFNHTEETVTTSSTTMLPANPFRRYLMIQNNHATGIVYLNLSGEAATVTNGIKIHPGGSYECQGFCPLGAITAIGSIASNPNVLAVEG